MTQPPRQNEYGHRYHPNTAAPSRQIPFRKPSLSPAIGVEGDLDSITEAIAKRREYDAYRERHTHLMDWMRIDHGYRRAISSVRQKVGLSPLRPFDLEQCAALSDGHASDAYKVHLQELTAYGQQQRNDTTTAEKDLIKRLQEK